MKRLYWFLVGALSVVLIGAIAGFALLQKSAGFSAREKPSSIEKILARRAHLAAIPSEAKSRTNPITMSDEVLTQARAHWADHCATCHANNGSGDVMAGRNMYPPAPDMRQSATQNLSDGELFYIIENGVRLSGMPAWGNSDHGEADSWKLVHFIRHLPQISFSEQKEMEEMNPKSPAELEEEKEEEQFLKGETPNEKKTK